MDTDFLDFDALWLESVKGRADWRAAAKAAGRLVYINRTSQTFSDDFTSSAGHDEYLDVVNQSNPKYKGCPNSKGSILLGYVRVSPFGNAVYTVTRINKVCNQWKCPKCSERKYRMLLERLRDGELLRQAERLVTDDIKYGWLFITLSVPGQVYRKSHTKLEAVDELRKNGNKLITAMKKRYGKFHYIAVVEPQRDGYPHIHMLMVGEKRIPKSILAWLRKTWRDKYGMGEIDVEAKIKDRETGKMITPRNAWSAILYATKYMSKSPMTYHGKNLFSYSRGALAPRPNNGGCLGAPIFVGYSDSVVNPRCGDSCEEFRTSRTDEIIEYKGLVEGIPCRASHQTVEELKRILPPGTLLPKRYIRKLR